MQPAGRAFADITVSRGEREWLGVFLVDTGADFTMIGTMGAIELMRDDYFLLDFDRDASRISIGGIGGSLRCVVRDFDLSVRTEDGAGLDLRAPIMIPELVEPSAGAPPRLLPSLLGRDLLGGGALTLVFRLPAELHFSNVPSGVQL